MRLWGNGELPFVGYLLNFYAFKAVINKKNVHVEVNGATLEEEDKISGDMYVKIVQTENFP